jgi:hypothetical protein
VGFATKINTALAPETATFSLFKLYRNSISLVASSGEEAAIDNIIIAASYPTGA